MLQRMLFIAVVGLALFGVGFVAIDFTAVAHEDRSCPRGSAGNAFLSMTDPSAPYDLRFIDEMIMHHEGAIMSSEMMIAESERPELRDLARRIQESQRRQIEQLREWREQWYPNAATPTMDMDMDMGGMMGDMGGMDGIGGMGGMMNGTMSGMMAGMMGGEQAAEMFLRMMIPHHQLAIDMAEDALKNAEHQELKDLAREIIEGQSAEITEMEQYLQEWYGTESTRDAAGPMREMMQRMMGGC